MRSPTKQDSTGRKTERASTRTASAPSKRAEHVTAEQPQTQVVTSMVDALEDILKWERASERAMRVAAEQSTTELDPSN
ncbi:MAG: hypothetical protein JWP87_4443 [Labilithrix sp.]|nr:hypothetical protein [Labilithrix sp.]